MQGLQKGAEITEKNKENLQVLSSRTFQRSSFRIHSVTKCSFLFSMFLYVSSSKRSDEYYNTINRVFITLKDQEGRQDSLVLRQWQVQSVLNNTKVLNNSTKEGFTLIRASILLSPRTVSQ